MIPPVGTANLLRQFSAYQQLRAASSPAVANALTRDSLFHHDIVTTVEDVEAWHRVNTAAVRAKLDIPAARVRAHALASTAVAALLDAVSQDPVILPPRAGGAIGPIPGDDLLVTDPWTEEASAVSLGGELYGYDEAESPASVQRAVARLDVDHRDETRSQHQQD